MKKQTEAISCYRSPRNSFKDLEIDPIPFRIIVNVTAESAMVIQKVFIENLNNKMPSCQGLNI